MIRFLRAAWRELLRRFMKRLTPVTLRVARPRERNARARMRVTDAEKQEEKKETEGGKVGVTRAPFELIASSLVSWKKKEGSRALRANPFGFLMTRRRFARDNLAFPALLIYH